MDKQIKTEWVEALRSGEFNQGRDFLHNTAMETYCCLGVLSTIIGKDDTRWDGEKWHSHHADETELDVFSGTIPSRVRNEIHFSRCEQRTVIDMNDTAKASFNEIADYIEKHF